MKNLLVLILIFAGSTASAQYNGGGRELVELETPEFVQVNQAGIHLERAGKMQLGALLCGTLAVSYTIIDTEGTMLPTLFASGALVLTAASYIQIIKAGKALRNGTVQ